MIKFDTERDYQKVTGATILHKNYETASPSPSVNVDWCYLGVTACKSALKTLFRITTLTEGEGELQGQEKNVFSLKETRRF